MVYGPNGREVELSTRIDHMARQNDEDAQSRFIFEQLAEGTNHIRRGK
jgi:hypothetical protein